MLAQLDADEATRLCRLLGMLGSAHDGEALNAARLADRFMREHGLMWAQIIRPRAANTSAGDGWRALALWIISNFGDDLREHEARFVGQMTTWRDVPSEKQQAWLKKLAERYGGKPL